MKKGPYSEIPGSGRVSMAAAACLAKSELNFLELVGVASRSATLRSDPF
jgi:hypothetical protein